MHAIVRALACVCVICPLCVPVAVRPLHQSVCQSVSTLLPPDLLEQLACFSSGRQRRVPPTHNWIIRPHFVLTLVFQDFYVYIYVSLQTDSHCTLHCIGSGNIVTMHVYMPPNYLVGVTVQHQQQSEVLTNVQSTKDDNMLLLN